MNAAKVDVDFRSEASRIDLNAAPKAFLIGLFAAIGVVPAVAEGYVDRIVAWRSISSIANPDNDPEDSLYRAAGLNYRPRHAPFPHVDEVWRVMGIPPAVLDRVVPYLTVYSGRPTINALEAEPQVIAALPGVTPQMLSRILIERQAGAGRLRSFSPDLLRLLGNSMIDEGTKAVRVSVAIGFDNGRRTGAEVVILPLDDENEPYRILWWRDQFDGVLSGDSERSRLR